MSLRVSSAAMTSYRGLRFIVRDFVFSEELIEKQKEELSAADTTEKELWVRQHPESHIARVGHTDWPSCRRNCCRYPGQTSQNPSRSSCT